MSHSTVLVIGPDPEKQLEPFDEQPEAGSPYLVFNDEEDEYLKNYNEESTKRIVLEDGTLVLPWDDRFKKPSALGFGSDTHEAPAHLERREVPFKETYATFEEYMADWCGYEKGRDPVKARYGSWRNPNAKWDWFVLGGRWTGFFQLKKSIALFGVQQFDKGELAPLKGNPFNREETKKEAEEWQKNFYGGKADQAPKGSIDFDRMDREAAEKASEEFDNWETYLDGRPAHRSWDSIRDELCGTGEAFKHDNIELARDTYHAQEVVKDRHSDHATRLLGSWPEIDEFLLGRSAYVLRATAEAYSTFAVLKDGVWHEQGEMGWWGAISGEKDRLTWAQEFRKLVHALPDSTLLSIYDVHI